MRAALLSIVGTFALLWVASFAYHYYFAPEQTTTGFDLSRATDVPFRELAHGTQSEVSRRTNYLITSTDQLRALWKIIDVPGQVPTVDFTKNDVVAVFAGDQSTAGYSIQVSAAADSQSRLIAVTLTRPGVSCLAAESITNPYQVIELPKTTLPLGHQDVQVTASCLQ